MTPTRRVLLAIGVLLLSMLAGVVLPAWQADVTRPEPWAEERYTTAVDPFNQTGPQPARANTALQLLAELRAGTTESLPPGVTRTTAGFEFTDFEGTKLVIPLPRGGEGLGEGVP